MAGVNREPNERKENTETHYVAQAAAPQQRRLL